MFIAYQKQRGIEYARLMESVRVDGCVKKKSGPNLGRVLDKERGIYQSKERGIFTFDLKTNTYGKPPQSYISLDISSGLGAPISEAELRIDLI